MKQFVISLIAVLIGGFLALLGYDRFIVQPREAAAAKAEAAAKAQASPANAQVDLGRARAEAQQVADEVEASVRRSVDGARKAMDTQAKEMDRRALAVDAASRATMFRVSLTEYYQSNGRWPRDADEAGLPAPTEMRGGAVREIRLGAQGVVTVKLDERFPEGSAIVLRPNANAASGMIDWTCEVKGDGLMQSLPRCKG
ncbi:MAG: pilin [Lysobacteraceae bacterium]